MEGSSIDSPSPESLRTQSQRGEVAPAATEGCHAFGTQTPGTLGYRLFSDGRDAFVRILQRIALAKTRIEVRAFVWRDDDTGRSVAAALLAAAERGVDVVIQKDRVAASYEYHGGTRQSLFHKRIGLFQRLEAWFLDRAYAGGGPLAQQVCSEADALRENPRVSIEHADKRFDHAKVWVFDDDALILGGMGIGDDHHHEWVDFMVEVEGTSAVTRLRERLAGHAKFDPKRTYDFLLHNRATQGTRHCPMLDARIKLIDSAAHSIHIAMAYLGDPRFTRALLLALLRGVDVTLVTSARADIMGNINRSTCNILVRRARGPGKLTVRLHPRMVHAKAIVIDGAVCDVGSANFTRLSHGVYDELNIYVNDAGFASQLSEALEARANEGRSLSGKMSTQRTVLLVEKAVVAYMSRRARRFRKNLPPSTPNA